MRATSSKRWSASRRDIQIDGGRGADLVAVGVDRKDCLELLQIMLEDEPKVTPELLAMIVQVAVAVGAWIERGRWQA